MKSKYTVKLELRWCFVLLSMLVISSLSLAKETTTSKEASVLVGNEAFTWKQEERLKEAAIDISHTQWLFWRVNFEDGDTLEFEKVSGPDWLVIDNPSNGKVTGTPTYADFGNKDFVFSVKIGFNPPVKKSFSLNVLPKTVRFLIVGNSFASNATRYLDNFAGEDEKTTLIFNKATFPSASLEQHLDATVAHAVDVNDPAGKPYSLENERKSLLELLTSVDWDVVTIQQVSTESDDESSYRPHATKLYDFITTNAPKAHIRFHQTWAYRSDDNKRYTDTYSQADMHFEIRKNYHKIARENNMKIVPVGEAFANAREHPDWNYTKDVFFYQNPVFPDLPNERYSLNLGFQWNTDNTSFKIDTHHASKAGEYLAGAVFFEALFGKSIINNSFAPNAPEGVMEELWSEDLLFLQQIAHDTVADIANTDPSFIQ